MQFHISRNGQTYGPYTLEDLRRYLASGNVLATDMARATDGAADAPWVPVSELPGIAGEPVPPSTATFSGASYADPATGGTVYTAPAYAAAGYPGAVPNAAFAASQYPDAPNLSWGLYLLFTILTCGIFSKVMTVVQAAWLRRVQPNSNALFFYIGLYVLEIFSLFRGVGIGMSMMAHPGHFPMEGGVARGVLQVVSLVLLIVTRFVMSASLEEHFNGPEPVGLRNNPAAVFFFGGIYFQYKLNKINALKQAARYGVGRTI